MGATLHIGHHSADDRCLWSEHPCRGASLSDPEGRAILSDESDGSDKCDGHLSAHPYKTYPVC